MRIAHLSDTHVNLRYAQAHFARLRKTLIHAIEQGKADHLVITGDLTTNADERDMLAVRKLFLELDILHSDRLSLVVGNHDIFGGPHLAEELPGWPDRCRKTDYRDQLARFVEYFPECFEDTITIADCAFPYAKAVGSAFLIGVNSVSPHSMLQNPVGSNGRVTREEEDRLQALLGLPVIQRARQRILLIHHHLFPTRDAQMLQERTKSFGLFELLEHGTLKLHGKRRLISLLKANNIDLVLHGHVHFTAGYDRDGIPCLNSGGSIAPINPVARDYHMIELGESIATQRVQMPHSGRNARILDDLVTVP